MMDTEPYQWTDETAIADDCDNPSPSLTASMAKLPTAMGLNPPDVYISSDSTDNYPETNAINAARNGVSFDPRFIPGITSDEADFLMAFKYAYAHTRGRIEGSMLALTGISLLLIFVFILAGGWANDRFPDTVWPTCLFSASGLAFIAIPLMYFISKRSVDGEQGRREMKALHMALAATRNPIAAVSAFQRLQDYLEWYKHEHYGPALVFMPNFTRRFSQLRQVAGELGLDITLPANA